MPAPTTLNAFVNNLADITIAGLVRRYDGAPELPPQAADLPALFPRVVEGTDYQWTAKSYGGWPTLVCELVAIVQVAGLDTVPANHQAVVDFIDAVNDGIRALDVGSGNFGKGGLTWSWRLSSEEVIAGQQYWAVVVRLEGRG